MCTVSDGAADVSVVCGAPNVRAGMKTAFARVGARLPEDFRIRKAKLRGVESNGMLCSGAELTISEDADGILELPDDLVPGTDLREALDLDDVTIDLDLTPNRGDCLGVKGIAREVGVLNDLPVAMPQITKVPAAIEDTFPVRLDAPDACPRYLGRVIRGVDLSAPTPDWMVTRLQRCGLRSIDAVVDVTNYVLLELGQPMHAFDLNVLQEGIVVRRAREGEVLTLLDDREVALDTDTLLIADASGPVAIGGVMGGARSGVQIATTDVFLECAFFSPVALAGIARRYGLQTDASHRYERGVDHGLQFDAIERATALLLDIVGGRAGPVTEAVAPEHLPAQEVVGLRESRLKRLLGIDIEPERVDAAFARLGFDIVSRDKQADGVRWQVSVPSHRFDLRLEVDLVEEVCRIYGYNNVASRMPATALELRNVPLAERPERALKDAIASHGYREVVTYSFVSPVMADLLDPGADPLALANPMSQEQSVMRTNLLPGLVGALRENLARQQQRVRIFEVGLCFPRDADGSLRQVVLAGGLLCGPRAPESWATARDTVDFFDVKGDLEALFAHGRAGELTFTAADDPVMHPGQSAFVHLDGAQVGRVGRLHPEIERRLELPATYFFEVTSVSLQQRRTPVYQSVSRYPSVRRDLAVVVDRSVTAAAIERAVRDAVGERLVDFTLFDVYQGKGIDSAEKSLALGLTLQDPSATLTDTDIARCTDLATSALERQFGARLR